MISPEDIATVVAEEDVVPSAVQDNAQRAVRVVGKPTPGRSEDAMLEENDRAARVGKAMQLEYVSVRCGNEVTFEGDVEHGQVNAERGGRGDGRGGSGSEERYQ